MGPRTRERRVLKKRKRPCNGSFGRYSAKGHLSWSVGHAVGSTRVREIVETAAKAQQ